MVSAFLCGACATAPRPTAASLALASNARAVVQGQVFDRQGHSVAGIAVAALPRERDIGWSPPATTDSEGRFRLTLFAPAEYGFLLRWKGRTVITSDPEDPAFIRIEVRPGDSRSGVRLLFLRERWDEIP